MPRADSNHHFTFAAPPSRTDAVGDSEVTSRALGAWNRKPGWGGSAVSERSQFTASVKYSEEPPIVVCLGA